MKAKASTLINKAKSSYLELGQIVGAFKYAPSRGQIQVCLFLAGIALLSTGLVTGSSAQGLSAENNYNDVRLAESVNVILTYLEGTFGALVMVVAGLAAILSSAFGQYRAALGALVVAVGSFILRSILGTFFNDDNIRD